MEANELKIGNLVSITCEAKKDIADTCHLDYLSELARDHFVIGNFSTDEINVFIGNELIELSLSEIEPIELNDFWMLRFGFKQVGINFEKDWLLLWKNKDTGTIDFVLNEPHSQKRFARHLMYVHELQNLHYSLTGIELKYI
jgi:hypothetical protein